MQKDNKTTHFPHIEAVQPGKLVGLVSPRRSIILRLLLYYI